MAVKNKSVKDRVVKSAEVYVNLLYESEKKEETLEEKVKRLENEKGTILARLKVVLDDYKNLKTSLDEFKYHTEKRKSALKQLSKYWNEHSEYESFLKDYEIEE